jgi:5-(carboxyamino)imidazole ribonucleotide synthase
MFALAANAMGYRVHVFGPGADSPAGQVSDRETVADYADEAAVRAFAAQVAAVTFEFENIPVPTVEWCAACVPVRPGAFALEICQHRLHEKRWLSENGFPVAPYMEVQSQKDLEQATRALGYPCILKTATFGYDGKGQQRLVGNEHHSAVWSRFQNKGPAVLEGFLPFERELSLIAARSANGEVRTWPVCENQHSNHILDVTLSPAPISPATAAAVTEIGRRIVQKMEYVGVLAIELFLMHTGDVVVNELAPRPHNSGHFSIDASVTSQFEQQVRAVCGLPLGDTSAVAPAAMANLLGDLWAKGEPCWDAALAIPAVKLHLYGKRDPAPGRKMGHLTALGSTLAEAQERVLAARKALERR